MGSADLSWSIDKELETSYASTAAKARFWSGWKESKLRRRGEAEWHTFGTGYDKIQAFRDQIENFCDAVRGVADLVVTPRDALASVEVIQAAYAALDYARWERIGSQLEDLAVVPLRVERQAS